MTSDQVLLDEAAPDAGAATTKPKTVRRRTTKTADAAPPDVAAPLAEQPTLPEMTNSETSAADPASAKPKRTRVVKAKTSTTEPEVPETLAEIAPEEKPSASKSKAKSQNGHSTEPTPSVVSAPVVEVAEPAADSVNQSERVDSTPVAVENAPAPEAEAPTRPSVPARFPSRFKRVTQPQAEQETTTAQEVPVEATAPVETSAVQTPVAEATVETPQSVETQAPSATETSEPQSEATPAPHESAATQDGPPSPENGGFAQNTQQEGDFGPQNGEPEGGFGRMRYRERREFRRQQRMQQRQERFGANGEPLPPQQYPQQAPMGQGQGQGPVGQNGFNNRPIQNSYQPPARRRDYDFFMLQALSPEELENAAREYNVEMEVERDRAELVMAVMEAQARTQNSVLKTGILDAHDHNKAFLRCEGYIPSENDVYVSQTQIKRFNLKTGDLVFGTARAPKENERFFGLLRVESINELAPDEMRYRIDFEKQTPIFPDSRYHLETEQGNITARIIDLVSPIGKGQRGLIVAPPKAGKTTLLKSIANSVTKNNPEAKLFVLLIDERPEEVTDISRSVRGEVVASTFDEMPENHMRVADIVLERAKRLVEMKHDVVILLDSITRLSRASNLVVTPSGRTLSGGLDPAAMYRPKRMFGAARNIEEGGSLTILATALVDTGSRMDEMIFEEFKGTGNMDLVLDRDLFNQRIFPAIDINKSGTRRDDLLMSKDELAATFHLRQTLARLDNDQAVKLLIDRLKNTKSNGDFMAVVAKSARQAEIKAAS